jgi:hypothetical protein
MRSQNKQSMLVASFYGTATDTVTGAKRPTDPEASFAEKLSETKVDRGDAVVLQTWAHLHVSMVCPRTASIGHGIFCNEVRPFLQ